MENPSLSKIGLLENIIQRIASPMFVIDSNHKILYWNNALAQLTGLSSFQMVGTKNHWQAFYSSKRHVMADLVLDNNLELLNKLYKKFTSSLFTSNAYQAEGWYDNLNNKRRYIFFEAVPIIDQTGNIVAAVETLEDITERKMIEEKVQDNNVFLKIVMEAIPNPVYFKDLEHRYIGCNAAFLSFFGREEESVIGNKLEEIMGQDFSHKSIKLDNKVIGSREHISYETTLLNSECKKRRVIAYKAPFLKHDGSLAGIVGSFVDITELHDVTRELKETQRHLYQQEKMASLGLLAAGVAHEINNPMSYISSNLGTLANYHTSLQKFINIWNDNIVSVNDNSTIAEVQRARTRLDIDHILNDVPQLISESLDGASRIRSIVQDLKNFSRVDKAETAYVNLNEVLETAVKIGWNEIKYVAELIREYGDIPHLTCNPLQLSQIFLNLLVNAAHSMEGTSNGSITIRTYSKDGNIFVEIIDMGCGIPEKLRERIFEPFFTTKEVGKGTGLGLSISYDFVQKHGGDITVVSEVGVGTHFTLRFPITE